ncbi:hypothetical protein AXG93_2779s1110 [Marchantia polymorpha subsp. ruderalis]|uniref:Uncharacterized protein n=1 Tax=Marchantia polymorpha subsp. ruderalis TaxID=1480154 RepID=A0A176W4I1_MARPO|nr:hypothetical protein AXG93_2779s1110 [Marchantia polymorpha subsp. ruderalis]
MRFLTKAEQRKFLIKREIVELDDDDMMGDYEVFSDEDDMELAQRLTEVKKANEVIEKRPMKKPRPAASGQGCRDSEVQVKKPVSTLRRTTNPHARKKVKSRRQWMEEEDSPEGSLALKGSSEEAREKEMETSGQCLWPSKQTRVSLAKELRLSRKENLEEPKRLEESTRKPTLSEETLERVVEKVGVTIADHPTMTSCQVSSGTVEFGCGEGTSAKEPKKAEISLPDFLCDSVIF